jgi:hypothetical protein
MVMVMVMDLGTATEMGLDLAREWVMATGSGSVLAFALASE